MGSGYRVIDRELIQLTIAIEAAQNDYVKIITKQNDDFNELYGEQNERVKLRTREELISARNKIILECDTNLKKRRDALKLKLTQILSSFDSRRLNPLYDE